jgi:hypothetical protein
MTYHFYEGEGEEAAIRQRDINLKFDMAESPLLPLIVLN